MKASFLRAREVRGVGGIKRKNPARDRAWNEGGGGREVFLQSRREAVVILVSIWASGSAPPSSCLIRHLCCKLRSLVLSFPSAPSPPSCRQLRGDCTTVGNSLGSEAPWQEFVLRCPVGVGCARSAWKGQTLGSVKQRGELELQKATSLQVSGAGGGGKEGTVWLLNKTLQFLLKDEQKPCRPLIIPGVGWGVAGWRVSASLSVQKPF